MDTPFTIALEACNATYQHVVRNRQQARAVMRSWGEQLLSARALCPSGQWEHNLREAGIHVRTARRAMEMARGPIAESGQLVRSGSGGPNGSGGAGWCGGDPNAGIENDPAWEWARSPQGITGSFIDPESEEQDPDDEALTGPLPTPASVVNSAKGAAGGQRELEEVYEQMASMRAEMIRMIDDDRLNLRLDLLGPDTTADGKEHDSIGSR